MSYVRIHREHVFGLQLRVECQACGAHLSSDATEQPSGEIVVQVRPCACAEKSNEDKQGRV